MPIYTRSQPVATDKLSTSQPILKDNTDSSDDSFSVDHYPFSNLTSNNGKHKQATTVVQGSLPTTSTDPILVAYQPYAVIGALQYSCGPSAAVPTPITKLQSPSAAIVLPFGQSTNVLNFTTIPKAMFRLTAADYTYSSGSNRAIYDNVMCWNGTSFVSIQVSNTILGPSSTGAQLKLTNFALSGSLNVFWVLEFLRIG